MATKTELSYDNTHKIAIALDQTGRLRLPNVPPFIIEIADSTICAVGSNYES